MLAQVYHMRNKYENIPQDILSNIDKMGMDDSSFLTELEGKYLNTVAGISEKILTSVNQRSLFLEAILALLEVVRKNISEWRENA